MGDENKDMSLEQKQALMNVTHRLQNELNAASWSDHMEELIKAWGEKAAGLRWMHNQSAAKWKQADRLTFQYFYYTSIFIISTHNRRFSECYVYCWWCRYDWCCYSIIKKILYLKKKQQNMYYSKTIR